MRAMAEAILRDNPETVYGYQSLLSAIEGQGWEVTVARKMDSVRTAVHHLKRQHIAVGSGYGQFKLATPNPATLSDDREMSEGAVQSCDT